MVLEVLIESLDALIGFGAFSFLRLKKYWHMALISDHPLYSTWTGMISRCCNVNDKNYQMYGGAGVRVCARWRYSFENFISDMGERPHGHSLDRYSESWKRTGPPLPYSPETCRWADVFQQARNTKANVILCIDGVDRCVSEWSVHSGVTDSTIRRRLRQGWTARAAVFTPARAKKTIVTHMYKGKRRTMSELSKISGVQSATLHSRLNSGWSLDRAIGTPISNNLLK